MWPVSQAVLVRIREVIQNDLLNIQSLKLIKLLFHSVESTHNRDISVGAVLLRQRGISPAAERGDGSYHS